MKKLKGLEVVEVEINHSCNFSCSYCPNSITSRPYKGKIDRKLFTKVISELAQHDFSGRVSFHLYNEPLLHPEIDELAKECSSQLKNAHLVIYSNGSLLSIDKFRKLVTHGVEHFVITEHEPSQFERKEFEFSKTFSELSNEERRQITLQRFNQINLTNRGGLLKNIGSPLAITKCEIPSHMLAITLQGKVLGCFEDYSEKKIMGDLTYQTIDEIWNSVEFNKFRQDLMRGLRHLHQNCNQCSRNETRFSQTDWGQSVFR